MSWQLDTGHTYIGFTGRHLMVSTVRGEFEKFSGTVEFDEQDITRSRADIQIEAGSVTTHNAQRDEHFRSADFFDVEHYPYITFTSKRVIMQDAQHGQLVGDLTIRDATHEIALDVEQTGGGKDPWGNQRLGFTAKATLNRSEWGLKWNQALEAGGVLVSDKVEIEVEAQVVQVGA